MQTPSKYGVAESIAADQLRESEDSHVTHCAPQSHIFCYVPTDGKQQKQRDDALRIHAVKTPDAERILLNHRQAQGEAETAKRNQHQREPLPQKRQRAQHDVAENADVPPPAHFR